MFERFTDRARHAVVVAQEEARRFNHNYIGTEHVLVALCTEVEGVAGRALDTLGISAEEVRQQIEGIVGRGQSVASSHMPFTPHAKRGLELALREALEFGHNYIGTEHLLLGLIRQEQDLGAQILERLGVDRQQVRDEVNRLVMGGVREARTVSASVRQDVTVGLDEMSGDTPRCPRCYADLASGLRAGTIEVINDETWDASSSLTVAWCPGCGTVVGPVQ